MLFSATPSGVLSFLLQRSDKAAQVGHRALQGRDGVSGKFLGLGAQSS